MCQENATPWLLRTYLLRRREGRKKRFNMIIKIILMMLLSWLFHLKGKSEKNAITYNYMKSKSSFIFSYSSSKIIIKLHSSTSKHHQHQQQQQRWSLIMSAMITEKFFFRMTFEEKSTLFLNNKRSKFKVVEKKRMQDVMRKIQINIKTCRQHNEFPDFTYHDWGVVLVRGCQEEGSSTKREEKKRMNADAKRKHVYSCDTHFQVMHNIWRRNRNTLERRSKQGSLKKNITIFKANSKTLFSNR